MQVNYNIFHNNYVGIHFISLLMILGWASICHCTKSTRVLGVEMLNHSGQNIFSAKLKERI